MIDRLKSALTLVVAVAVFSWAILHSLLGYCTRWGCGRSFLGMWLADQGGWGALLVGGVEDARIVIAVGLVVLYVFSVARKKIGSLADRF